VETAGEFEIVILRARSAAQGLKVEPDHAAGTAQGAHLTSLDIELRILVRHFRNAQEGIVQRLRRSGVEREMIGLDLAQRTLAVIRSAIDIEDVELVLQQIDRRQDAVAMQAV